MFKALILEVAPPLSRAEPSTLSQYAFPGLCTYRYRLEAVDENFYLKQLDKWAGWIPPGLQLASDQMQSPKSWTQVYEPSQVMLCYDRSEDVLVELPQRVQLRDKSGLNDSNYFLKSFVEHGPRHQLSRELATFKKICISNIEAGARISRLRGVVATKDSRVIGLILTWIEAPKSSLQYQYWRQSLPTRIRWAAQIRETMEELHKEGVVWGDAKLDNVLLYKDNTPWVIDFEGGYTPGWVDRERGGTVEGGLQGLERIVGKLSRSPPFSDFSSY